MVWNNGVSSLAKETVSTWRRPIAEKWQDRKSKRTRQKNKRGDRKGESNDSPEIPDRGETSDIPWPPFGVDGGGGGAEDNSLREQDNGLKKEKICKQPFIAVTECICTLCLCYCTLCVKLSASITSFFFFCVGGRIMTSFTSFFFYYFLFSYIRWRFSVESTCV